MSNKIHVKHPPIDVDICPVCGCEKIISYDSRNNLGYRRRMKKCSACDYRYSTLEVLTEEWVELKEGTDSYERGYHDGKADAISLAAQMIRQAMDGQEREQRVETDAEQSGIFMQRLQGQDSRTKLPYDL